MVNYVSPIDPHVHLRGTEYTKPFLNFGYIDAGAVGLAAMVEQPNPVPQLVTVEAVRNRFAQVKRFASANIRHSIHPGLTNDLKQVESILRFVMDNDLGVCSDKMFYVHSTGDMGILDPVQQKRTWEVKARLGYKGVSIGHFEDETAFTVAYDPLDPITHSLRQNPEAETIQVERQLRFARDLGFQGTFYIAHTSNPATVDYVLQERKRTPFPIVMEVTWHHMFLNTSDYVLHGNRVKMNPPLRDPALQERLLGYVLQGKLDVLGTDHAGHPIEAKDRLDPAPASGIPVIPFYPKGIELLQDHGIDQTLLHKIIFTSANQLFFGGTISPRNVSRRYDPFLWTKYGFNPFSRIDGS